ncbi:hypothetical protein M011DRAFT_480156 [Sporormia fimetaria CBS 119925]|uniref:Uncharacterized protein n=1 Tax=Sporormia fimetaria CBS 119925 TaxID=1340428 RepID=A0A6A6V3B2_9PLEO|nr:hypothetical protein M011DRAFT_480156 [Sporormia fimetaria CBS 119925]
MLPSKDEKAPPVMDWSFDSNVRRPLELATKLRGDLIQRRHALRLPYLGRAFDTRQLDGYWIDTMRAALDLAMLFYNPDDLLAKNYDEWGTLLGIVWGDEGCACYSDPCAKVLRGPGAKLTWSAMALPVTANLREAKKGEEPNVEFEKTETGLRIDALNDIEFMEFLRC